MTVIHHTYTTTYFKQPTEPNTWRYPHPQHPKLEYSHQQNCTESKHNFSLPPQKHSHMPTQNQTPSLHNTSSSHLRICQHHLGPTYILHSARWPSGLERWTGDRTVRGSNPTAENFSLRNFGNSVYPALPVSFGGDTKSRRSLLSGVYARGSKRPHQSALECVTVVDSTAHSKLPQKCVYAAENAALH